MSIFQNDLKTIGIFNDSFPPIMDGVSLTAQNYAHWLHKKNQPVCVVTPNSPHYTDHEPYPVYRYTSIPILGRKPYRMGLPNIDLSFQAEIEQLSFGLVHAHCPFSSGRIALNIARKQNIPIIATFHSKYRDDFEHSVHNKFLAKQMTNGIIRFFEKVDEVWIPQASVEETIREYGYKGKVEIVNNGTDFSTTESAIPLKLAAKEKFNIKPNEIVLLFVGQHIWEKNIRLIIESLGQLSNLNFKMYFVGTGYAKDEMIQLVEKYCLKSKIEFVDVIIDRNILKEYYAAADLFLFPSIYDNAPLVLREAAALETPAILINGSSSAESIEDNFNGFLTENDVNAFSIKLQELISTPDLLKTVGLNASKTIARSWESVTEEVLDRYNNLINRKWRK